MPAEEEDYTEPPPPSPEKVARRVLVLSAVCCRGMIDDQEEAWAAELSEQIWPWLRGLALENELSTWERALLQAPFGGITSNDKINASWLSEAMVVLAWSLGKEQLPEFDKECLPQDVGNSVGFMQSREETVLENPQLLSIDVLSEYNEFIYNLHWRTRDYSIRPGPYDFESLARKAWENLS